MLNKLFGDEPTGDALEEVLNFISAYYHASGVGGYDSRPDMEMLRATLCSIRAALRKLDKPSLFKKLAVFTHYFIFQCPLSNSLPLDIYPEEVVKRFYH